MAKTKRKKLPVYMIRWEDHTSNDAWVHKDELHKEHLVVVTSIGWLVRQDKKTYVLAAGWSSDGDLTNLQTIGKAMVVETKKIGVTNDRAV